MTKSGTQPSTSTASDALDERHCGYSIWDTLKDLRFNWPWFFAATPHAARRARSESRTSMYAAAAGGKVDLSQLAEDLAKRRAMWERHLDDPAAAPTTTTSTGRGGRWLSDWFILGFDELAWLVVLAGIAFVIASLAASIAMAIPWLVWHIARLRRRAACRRAIERHGCPDCGYDLTGAPEPIDRAMLRGLSAGPNRCPECGSPWPLLPPPVR